MSIKTFLGSIVALSALSAQAITYNANTDGTSAPTGASFLAVGGSLEIKTVSGWSGLGVSGGAAGGEIDLGQTLQVFFSTPTTLDQLTLAFLFDGPEFGDPQEVALTVGFGNYFHSYLLKVTGENTAIWTGPGSAINLSPATATGAGVWEISTPFGDDAITFLGFAPGSLGSDFSLQSFSSGRSTSVPDGGATAVLLGLGVAGLAYAKRRK